MTSGDLGSVQPGKPFGKESSSSTISESVYRRILRIRRSILWGGPYDCRIIDVIAAQAPAAIRIWSCIDLESVCTVVFCPDSENISIATQIVLLRCPRPARGQAPPWTAQRTQVSRIRRAMLAATPGRYHQRTPH